MFQQTFIHAPESSRKPYSMGLSILLQAAVVAFLSLIPLLYGPGLPSVQLRSFLLAPPPPSAPAVLKTVAPTARIPTSHRFIFRPDTVDRVARAFSKEAAVTPAPGIDIAGATGDPNGSLSPILGAVDPSPAPPLQVKASPTQPVQPKTLRLGGTVAEANLIQKVQPVYPALARSARVSGTVEFSATISREGLIENLQLLRGHPLLVSAAKQAILQWRYKPTLLNGQPVEVITSIVVNFNLN